MRTFQPGTSHWKSVTYDLVVSSKIGKAELPSMAQTYLGEKPPAHYITPRSALLQSGMGMPSIRLVPLLSS